MKLPRFAALVLSCLPMAVCAQVNGVFNDSFTGDSLDPATYPAVTPTKTGWDVASGKAAPAPTNSSGLQINMASTSSGFVEAQALFASSPVQLLPGTYIELTGTFVPTNLLVKTNDSLNVGLFNSGGTPPISGLLNSGLVNTSSTFASGGAKGWNGYNAYFIFTGGTAKMGTRAAQTGTNNLNQDLLFGPQSSTSGYSTPAPATISQSTTSSVALTNGATYTLDYKLSLSSSGTTITAVYSIYNGTGTSGTGSNALVASYSGTITGTTLLTQAFDGMSIGWRADASLVSDLNFSSLTVSTTGGVPWFITQPPASTTVQTGNNFTIAASVGGSGVAYQWKKSTDGGVTFSPINTATNPTAATASLTITGAQSTDAGIYELVATNSVGSVTSTQATVNVTAAAVAPSIAGTTGGGTILVGSLASFSVTANGTNPLSYQWYKSVDGGNTYVPITGATSSSFSIAGAALTDTGLYEVIVTNSAGNATSAALSLVVDQAPAFTAQPSGAILSPGATFTVSVSAVGTPAPTFQWYLNGNPIAGATQSTYTIPSVSGANAGNYTVVIANSAGASVTSSVASLVVLSPTLAASAVTPVVGSMGLEPDARLTITFNGAIAAGVSGKINIYDASNPSTPVDTIDMVAGTALMNTLRASSTISTLALPVQNKTVGGLSNFNYYPLTVAGSTATIYPRNNVLAYGKTYYVTIDPGVFTDGTGLAFPGISGAAGWTFSTKASGPAAGATSIVVAADGSGDFCTVQGALDFIPGGNTTPTTINIRNGTYFEQVYFTAKHSITFLGQDRTNTVVAYPNNNTFNNVSGTYHRMVLQGDHVNNVVFNNLTIQNTTAHGGSQAEALLLNGTTTSQATVTNVNLYSFQDTLQINGQAYISNSHIEGDVDFMWGVGPNFFYNCELTALTSNGYYTQIRNTSANHGNLYLNCTLDCASGVTGSYLARIDPTPGTGFPDSEVVYLNSVMGTAVAGTYSTNINPAGWLLNNQTTAPNVDFAEYDSQYSDGTPLNVSSRAAFSQQLTAAANAVTIANDSTPSYWLGNGWSPALAPVFISQPAAASIPQSGTAAFTAIAAGGPAPAYQWFLNGVALADGAQADGSVVSGSATTSLTIKTVMPDENGAIVSVVASNASGSATSSPAVLTVLLALPTFTAQPAAETVSGGSGASFTAAASGASSYQWYFNGAAIGGNPSASTTTLTVGSVTPLNAGTYTLGATNSGGTAFSSGAILNVTAAAGSPTLPVIPNGVFKVTAYGAVGDGVSDNTTKIQAAISAALAAGGGTVEIPAAASNYMCGPVTLGSNVSLQVDSGATLQALPYGTYPDANNSPANFVSVSNAANVQIVGGGTIDGNGSAWWTAFANSSSVKRPQLVKFSACSDVLVAGVTLSNGPTEHLVPDNATNMTIDGITISAPGTSPNTDGIDPSGTNILIENCSISEGDDNIAVKPQTYFCSNITVTGCAFGSGHGMSVGGQTNAGLNGMTVTNCTFNGTTTGLRLKADATEGGLVQNVSYSNLTMTNVPYPIAFWSYYNQVGTPGETGGSSETTPAKVNSWNSSPPNSLAVSTIPGWQNITISNLTATGATGYSIIWGLPLANGFFSNVGLNNVNITGGAGLEIYNAANVQVTGASSVGAYVADNALAITSQPQNQSISAGGTAVFSATVVGTSGIASIAPTYRWSANGTPLTDGPQADGSKVNGSATSTLTISNAKVTNAGAYALTASNNLDGFNVQANSLSTNSLPVSATSGTATLAVQQSSATVTLSNLSQTFTEAPVLPTVTTSPAGLFVALTYNGSNATPATVGSYAVVATVIDPSYTGSASGILTISPAMPVLSWNPPAPITYGTALGSAQLDATANTAGSFAYAPAAGTVLGAGSNQALSATFTPPDTADYISGGTVGTTITVNAAAATVTLSNLSQAYTGSAESATVTTSPANLGTNITYNGGAAAPTAAGSYAVVATVTDPNYTGSATGTLVISKATASLTLGALSQTYGGGIEDANAATSPAGLTVLWSYNGQPLAFTAGGDTLAAYAPAVGQTLYVNATGTTGGTVAGSNPIFGIGSDLGTAAVQAGVLAAGQSAVLQVTISGDGTTFAIVGVATSGFTNGPVAVGTYAVTGTIVDWNYSGFVTGTLTITQATPVVAWSAPSAITYGTALDGTQLNATANVPGAFTYAPAAGTILGAGASQPLSVTFTPTDSTDYTNASASTTISVNLATATVTLSNLSQTYSGSPESATVATSPANLNTTVTYNGSATAPTAAGSYTVVATVSDPNYTGSATGTLVIGQASPVLAWNTPAPIVYGTALGSTQLDATAIVAGSFAYSPVAGTALSAGANQALGATFTPSDTTDYSSGGTVGTTITVVPQSLGVTLSGLSAVYDGTPKAVTATPAIAGLAVSTTYNGSSTAPTAAGSYAVVAMVNNANYTGSATGTLVIAKATPVLSWSAPAAISYGTTLGSTQLDANASVAGSFTYVPNAGTVLPAGANQALGATFAPSDSVDFANGTVGTTITVNTAAATVTLSNLGQIYTGTPKTATVTTVPASLGTTVTYNGSSTAPTAAGSYAVVATVTSANYTGSTTGTLVIGKATPVLSWSAPAAITYGTPLGSAQLDANSNVAGSFVYAPSAGTVLAAGANQPLGATFTPTDAADYSGGTVSTAITIKEAAASIVLSGLDQYYTGQPLKVSATTSPVNLSVSITYNGGATAPTYPGSYAVVASITDPNYSGTASGTMVIGTTGLVNHAPVLNGNAAFEGSIQMLSAENVNMSGNAYISGDLLVPGTPTLEISGNAMDAGTKNAGGTATPTNYQVSLSGKALLRYLVRQVNPVAMPTVAAPPSSNQNVTLNGNAPPTTLAAGNYGTVIVNGNTTLIVGVAGATTPSVCNIQNLTLNGNGTLEVVGPVILTVDNSVTLNGNCGASAHPEWLVLAVANGGVTLNGSVTFDGSIVAPSGQVIVNGNSTLNGTVISNSLLLNGGAVVDPSGP